MVTTDPSTSTSSMARFFVLSLNTNWNELNAGYWSSPVLSCQQAAACPPLLSSLLHSESDTSSLTRVRIFVIIHCYSAYFSFLRSLPEIFWLLSFTRSFHITHRWSSVSFFILLTRKSAGTASSQPWAWSELGLVSQPVINCPVWHTKCVCFPVGNGSPWFSLLNTFDHLRVKALNGPGFAPRCQSLLRTTARRFCKVIKSPLSPPWPMGSIQSCLVVPASPTLSLSLPYYPCQIFLQPYALPTRNSQQLWECTTVPHTFSLTHALCSFLFPGCLPE